MDGRAGESPGCMPAPATASGRVRANSTHSLTRVTARPSSPGRSMTGISARPRSTACVSASRSTGRARSMMETGLASAWWTKAHPASSGRSWRSSSPASTEAPTSRFFSVVCPNDRDPISAPIELEVDREARRARFSLGGVGESSIQPIVNPEIGPDEHRVRIDLPNGFEYKQAEIANSVSWTVASGDPLAFSHENTYTQLYEFDWSNA